MNTGRFTLLIPNALPALIGCKGEVPRITATLIGLRSRFPEGRFDFKKIAEVAKLFGFDGRKGFKEGHLDKLKAYGLLKYEKNAAHKTTYVTFATWQEIQNHFNYEEYTFLKYEVDFCTSANVLDIIASLCVKHTERYFEEMFSWNLITMLENDFPLYLALETVCGKVTPESIHRYQLELYTKGILPNQSDEYYCVVEMLLHATKRPNAATGEEKEAKRFYIKGDMNVSTGYMSRTLEYKGRNGFCHRKKRLQDSHLAICERRECKVEKGVRKTEELRNTVIGTYYYDTKEQCLKLRLVDQWTHISPEIAFSNKMQELLQKLEKVA